MAKRYKPNVIETHLAKINKNKLLTISKYILHTILIFIVFFMLHTGMKFLNGVKNYHPFDFSKYNAYYWCTFLIWFATYLILKGITGKTKLSLLIIVFVEYIFDMINMVVINTRGSAITISDIVAIPTVMSVASNLEVKWTIAMTIATSLFVAIILWIIVFNKCYIQKNSLVVTRIVRVVIGIVFFIVLANSPLYKEDSLWDLNYNYLDSGSPITALRLLQNFKVRAPKGYNKNTVKSLLASYEKRNDINFFDDIESVSKASDNFEQEDDKPNIIIIVNESFCDFYNTYNTGNSNPLKYFDTLMEQEGTISGTVYSSAFGGETANVEFEFLTQNSLRILPVGSFPFQQYVSREMKGTINNVLKSQGYKTEAYHPWQAYSYSRNKVYKLFNFDETFFLDDMKDRMRTTFNNDSYPDDSSFYEEVIRHSEAKDDGQLLFQYLLTMQNHIGYQNSNPEMEVYHDDWERNIYMQLLHSSEEALREYIDYLSEQDEKYILLFFGDHQPKLDVIDDTNGKKFEVPFLIWANYEIPTKHNISTSTVFLQSILLEAAGLKKSGMNNYMLELYNEIPVITGSFFMDKGLNYYENTKENLSKFPKLNEYDKICYYRIFDENKIKE